MYFRTGHDIRKLLTTYDLSDAPLFTQNNLAEITHPDFPEERLIACYNPLLAANRARTREELLEATEKQLGKLQAQIERRTRKPLSAAEIGVRAGRVINRYKVAKHFALSIDDNKLEWERREEHIAREASLDGIGEAAVRFARDTEPNMLQVRIFDLLKAPHPYWQQDCAQSVEPGNSR